MTFKIWNRISLDPSLMPNKTLTRSWSERGGACYGKPDYQRHLIFEDKYPIRKDVEVR